MSTLRNRHLLHIKKNKFFINFDIYLNQKLKHFGGSDIFSITIYLCLFFEEKEIKQRDKRASASLQKRNKQQFHNSIMVE